MILRLTAVVRAATIGACFVLFGLGATILSWIALPVARLLMWRRSEAEKIRGCQRIVGAGFRFFHRVTSASRSFVWNRREMTFVAPSGPFVMIANHPTLLDVTCLMAIHPEVCCVAKSSYFRSIMIGPLLRQSGQIDATDGIMEGAAAIQQALDRLTAGHPVLIFPEGTRSPALGLNPFRRGAFEIAIRAGVPVVPVFLFCNPPTLMKGLPWWALPKQTAYFRTEQLPTIPVESLGTSSRALSKRLRGLFQDKLNGLIVGSPSNPS